MGQAEAGWVYVVDDNPYVLNAIRRLLQTEGYNVRTFDSARAFLDSHDPVVPGCVLLDVGMPELDGLETQKQMLALGDTRPVIFVTGQDDVRTSVMAMKAGARDYLTKPVTDHALLAAVSTAVQSDMAARQERVYLANLARRWQSLSNRERDVMKHVVRGRLNKQIAFDLGIVEKTVKVHRAHGMEKLEARSVAALVHIAEQLKRADQVWNSADSHADSDGQPAWPEGQSRTVCA